MEVPIRIGEDFRKASPTITLELAVNNLQADDDVEISINGQRIREIRPDGNGRLKAPLDPKQLLQGKNQALLKLAQRSAKSDQPRTVTALEIHVTRTGKVGK